MREDDLPDGPDEDMTALTANDMSFKGILMNGGNGNSNDNMPLMVDVEEDDIKLLEGDVLMSVENENPSIKFSESVNNLVNESMSKTIILKLLGRRIGFNALRSKTLMLWKTNQLFQLMDLENNYYVAKFRFIDDQYEGFDEGTVGDLWSLSHCLVVDT
ncbi:hypothetical protein Gogos_008532 [Gossypium gossypioides]|uniref:DUF4283 domain-containing protein n=1 Tax=Gossypium gossypioides TaxID=34282 RepID=A0A7J9CCT6_GOSGO|nr:hypothetical protein [Gossypium gossypioides]